VGGYTGRAVIIPASDFAKAEVVISATNPRQILSIILPHGSVFPYSINNVFNVPFSGSNTVGDSDSGRSMYKKTLAIRVPRRGADTSKDIIEPLVNNPDGFVVIAEKRDKVGDGSFEVIGYQNSLRGDIASVNRDENANGGDWLLNLTTTEVWAEVTLVGAGENYESAKKEFEGLLSFEPMITRMILKGSGRVSLSANGLVFIDYMQGGRTVRDVYTALRNTYVSIPAGVEATVYGEVTAINKNRDLDVFSSLDVSKNTALTELYCSESTGLTSLDVSNNTSLTILNLDDCSSLAMLNLKNTPLLTSGIILDQSMAVLTTLQLAGTSSWVYEQAESWLSDYAPEGGMLYVDENTPQGVITEAEGKSWDVIYVS
jgi:hypothetical protein